MPHEDIGDEDDDGDDNWQGRPQVHTGCIQVFDDPESPQFSSSAGLYSGPQRLLPPEELDDPNATQQLCYELGMETRGQCEVETLLLRVHSPLPRSSWQRKPSTLNSQILGTSLAPSPQIPFSPELLPLRVFLLHVAPEPGPSQNWNPLTFSGEEVVESIGGLPHWGKSTPSVR